MDEKRRMWLTERLDILERLMGRPGFWERSDAVDICAEHTSVVRTLERAPRKEQDQ